MSYAIYDSKGYVGDLASNKGLADLRSHIHASKNGIAIRLIHDATYLTGPDLMDALAEVPKSSDTTVNDTLINLRELAGKCSDVVIITDGAF